MLIFLIKPIPWKEMLTSKVILGLIVTNLCSNFGVSLFITCLPTYINDVLEFDVESVKSIILVFSSRLL